MILKYGLLPSDNVGLDIDLEDITSNLKNVLDKFGLLVDNYYAYRDTETGDIFLFLQDEEGDSVNALMTIDDDGVPGISILNDKDREEGWIDLDGIVPVSNSKINFGTGSWFRYSVLSSLLKSGNVDFKTVQESKSKKVTRTLTKIEEAFSVRGSNKIAVVSHRHRNRKLSVRQMMGLASAKRKFQDRNKPNPPKTDYQQILSLESRIKNIKNYLRY